MAALEYWCLETQCTATGCDWVIGHLEVLYLFMLLWLELRAAKRGV